MEVAKISSKGQITIPISVRNKLKLRAGDKIVILEENGRFYFENSAMLAFKRAEEAFAGEAQKAGFETEEDMQEYMKEIRKEVRGYAKSYVMRTLMMHGRKQKNILVMERSLLRSLFNEWAIK